MSTAPMRSRPRAVGGIGWLMAVALWMGCTAGSQPAEPAEADIEATALRAYEAFAQGWATGDFGDYVAMLAPSFEFSYPLGDHRGHFTGTEGYTHMVNKVLEHSNRGERLTLEPPLHVMVDGDRVGFLFESHGQFGEYQYRAQNLIVFGVSEGQITTFREFLGDIEPSFICQP